MKTRTSGVVVQGGDPCPKKQRIEGKCKGGNSEEKHESSNDKGGRYPIKRSGYVGFWTIREFYNSSETPKISRICQDELVFLTQLAMWSYNIKEVTNFDKVEVLRAKRSMAHHVFYYITFKAFSPDGGVATTFQTKILYYFPKPCPKVDIIFVRIRPSDSDSDDFAESSQLPRTIADRKDKFYKQKLYQLIKTQTNDPESKLSILLSQFALVVYNFVYLHLHTEAMHDIPSLKIVKPMAHDGKRITYRTTYPITFQASLCDDSKNVETFGTDICIPTLFPTTTIEFWNFMKINPN